jgi:hypothetical protein
VIRGRDDQGNDLVIARDYIAHGLRARAADLVTRELGPETAIEAARKLQQEVTAERFTRLDRSILRDATDGRLELAAKPIRDSVWHATRMRRLRTLERMGLAEENTPGHWQIDAELEARLRRMGERGDIIKTIHRELAAAGVSRAPGTYLIFDPARGDQRLIGRVVGEGFSDELSERRYVVIDDVDGERTTRRSVSFPPVKSRLFGAPSLSSDLAQPSRGRSIAPSQKLRPARAASIATSCTIRSTAGRRGCFCRVPCAPARSDAAGRNDGEAPQWSLEGW